VLTADCGLASDQASFALSLAEIRLIPDWSELNLLPQRMVVLIAKEIMFTAERISASASEGIGLVHKAYPPLIHGALRPPQIFFI
jgi:enoyl-CoA hydratase/carnithine racemase